MNEEELLEQLKAIKVEDVILQTTVTLVNLAGQRIVDEKKDLEQARLAIDSARALLPFCPEEESKPIQQALSQVQMLWAQAQAPGSEPAPEPEPEPEPKPESKLWTPPGSTS